MENVIREGKRTEVRAERAMRLPALKCGVSCATLGSATLSKSAPPDPADGREGLGGGKVTVVIEATEIMILK